MSAFFRLVLVGLIVAGGNTIGRKNVFAQGSAPVDGAVVKTVVDTTPTGENLLKDDAWRPWQDGFEREGDLFICDNGTDRQAQRGAGQTIVLNQTTPEPIVASAESKAQGVTGSPGSDYSVYLDLLYTDGSHLWGQTAPFEPGTHDWQRRQVVVLPEKPVRQISFYVLLRNCGGKAWFRNPQMSVLPTPPGATMFDGVFVAADRSAGEGFQVRDAAAGSGFVRIDRRALGLKLDWKETRQGDATIIDATLTDTTGRDRAVALVYAVPVAPERLQWLGGLRSSEAVVPRREYMEATRFSAGAGRGLSRWPLAAVAGPTESTALAIDMAHPAFYRIGYNSGSGELFLAYDLGLTPEKPSVTVRFCRFPFDSAWGLRGALDKLYTVFPEQFRCKTPRQGLWMPFAAISKVEGWEDFGFAFKEGNGETVWDDEHDIITFRYTEPMTWWMRMPEEMPRTIEAAQAEVRRLAEQGNRQAQALLASGYYNREGQWAARLLDTPWCNGAVWSMNSMPGIAGEVTDFSTKWNPSIRQSLYGPDRRGDLDGEYIDSSEGYVTDELDFRRDHFAAADTPLTFCRETHRPAIFRGLIAFEYVRGIARDVHAMNKLMMANGAPTRLCWLAPMLEVMGTETDWNRENHWTPMSDGEMLYRRALCKGKPYCFLMNTNFDEFPPELVEKYMKRSLAYGMFPGFFSHNAAEGHYFTRPELYNRDRPLFKRYVPLCRLVAEAGWEPITLARTDDEHVYVERFGDRYLTVFNDSDSQRTVTITLDGLSAEESRERVSGQSIVWQNGQTTLTLEPEDVAVIELRPETSP